MLVKPHIVLSVFFLLKSCYGQVKSPGFCPKISTVPNFNALWYSGLWFEYKRYFTIFQQGIECSRARYRPTDGGRILVRNSGFNTRTGRPTVIKGFAYAPNPGRPGRLIVDFPSSPSPPGNYWVLDTDYKTFSIVYSCRDTGRPYSPVKSEILYILTRRPGYLPRYSGHRILRKLRRNRLNPEPLMLTRQQGCPRDL